MRGIDTDTRRHVHSLKKEQEYEAMQNMRVNFFSEKYMSMLKNWHHIPYKNDWGNINNVYDSVQGN